MRKHRHPWLCSAVALKVFSFGMILEKVDSSSATCNFTRSEKTQHEKLQMTCSSFGKHGQIAGPCKLPLFVASI